jgi:D-alanyl-D-alanine carboxypeptidase
LDAISSITSRISYIESQLAALRAGGTPGGAPTGTATASAGGTAFAEAYATALGGGAGSGSVGVGASGVGTLTAGTVGTGKAMLNAKGVPLELVAYGNGKIPAGALHQVGDTRHRLWTPAAQSLTALVADARRAGVSIGITDSYRSYAEQVDLVRRKGLYSQGGLAAKPGTSDHGWGMAVDLDLDSGAQAWMRANGAKYGFREDTPREPWHWAYTPRV